MKKYILIIAVIAFVHNVKAQTSGRTGKPLMIETNNLSVSVDPVSCRWSVKVKGTEMQMNNVHFLPGDDPSGWKVVSSINKNDVTSLGKFETISLKGTKPGQLDFDYKISVSKTGNDLLIGVGRTNNTGKTVNINDVDYFFTDDARLGGTADKWIDLGTYSRNRDYYYLNSVTNLVQPLVYEVNHVVKDSETGNGLLLGQVTTIKGESMFAIAEGWEGKTNDRMQVHGYCRYKVAMPAGESFPGEKLLINFNSDALRAMEHQADLIAIASDVRLKERRPINLDDKELVANDYSRFHGWMSGGTTANANKFFKENGLYDFFYGLGGPGRGGSWGVYGMGGSITPGGATKTSPSHTNYPPECYLPIQTVKYGGDKVIDFSNPLAVKLERERAEKWVDGHGKETGRAEMDFADWWDKWPGQFNPYMTSLETYRAGGQPWRDVIDQKAPRMVVRSNMTRVDYSYGLVDILRVSEDADHGYEDRESKLAGIEFTGLFGEAVLGLANRFFYNGRVYWNDGDGFHVYKYLASDGKLFNYGQAKVDANFHAIAGNTLFVEEAFDTTYPADRIELLKRIGPPTMDVAYPVDLFVRRPAQVWNMPVERPFGKWDVLSVFNYTAKDDRGDMKRGAFSTELDAAKDLRLDPNKEYIVYEFWTQKLVGTFKGKFTTRPVNPYDCDIYSIVEKEDHPVLISTSRHIRQMAFDIKDLAYDRSQQTLKGTSRAVAGDPYQLRIYVPDGFNAKRVELSDGLTSTMKKEGNLLTIDYKTSNNADVQWKVFF